jgi:adenosylhomocysteine nucleosidase
MDERSSSETESGRADDRRVAPAPAPADIGVVAAMPMEVSDLTKSLKKVWKYQAVSVPVIEGEHAGKIVAVAIGGMGRASAKRAADVLIAGHKPKWIISAGFAGGLNPALGRNDLVVPHEIVDREGAAFAVDTIPELDSIVAHARGRLLTVDKVVLRASEKEALYRSLGVDLVDMETSAVAAVCRDRGIRFLPIRVISDDARGDLPQEIASIMNPSGVYRFGATLRSVWNRPSSVKDFWRLYEHSIEAADRLARFVVRCIDVLPP